MQHWLRLLALVGICVNVIAFAQPAKAIETASLGSATLLSVPWDDVGVIPDGNVCPNGQAPIVIAMDDEDSRNANARGGWIGATISDRNTTFRFCRVPGSLFKALSTSGYSTDHYAVLKLGTVCPRESVPFSRYFDNQDGGNANSYSGDIYPNFSRENTELHFCLFRGASDTMSEFPQLGIGYGVFAAGDFSRAFATGYVHTDDEDRDNQNGYTADGSWLNQAQWIVTGGKNTDLRMARVR
ncbi:MAG TPA: hypothetical protein VFS21_35540 [Roseiflexaceae bacterium]|nr:hypothetical protein [Roseiflexaceae bacterium]